MTRSQLERVAEAMRLAALGYVTGDRAGELANNVAQSVLVPAVNLPSETEIRLNAERAIAHRAANFGLECRDTHYCALAMARAAGRVLA